MSISYVGNMKLNGYRITNTLSGSCNGSIIGANISASTNSAPYLVSWSGTNTLYTANTLQLFLVAMCCWFIILKWSITGMKLMDILLLK